MPTEATSHWPTHLAILARPPSELTQASLTEGVGTICQVAFVEYGIPNLTVIPLDQDPDAGADGGPPASWVDGMVAALEGSLDWFHATGVCVDWIGEVVGQSSASPERVEAIRAATADAAHHRLNVGLGYCGRAEIVGAAQHLLAERLARGDAASSLTEAELRAYLHLGDQPDPDLVVRVGPPGPLGDALLWQQAYAEFHTIETPLAELDPEDLRTALQAYGRRQRRFGAISLSPTGDRTDNA
ncbi:MAG: undecaprenyl diphosphate synthase family protein [Salinibacter sp.]